MNDLEAKQIVECTIETSPMATKLERGTARAFRRHDHYHHARLIGRYHILPIARHTNQNQIERKTKKLRFRKRMEIRKLR